MCRRHACAGDINGSVEVLECLELRFHLAVALAKLFEEHLAQILRNACDEIIERQNFPSFCKQPIANMRTKKSRRTSDHRAHEASVKAGFQFSVGAAD